MMCFYIRCYGCLSSFPHLTRCFTPLSPRLPSFLLEKKEKSSKSGKEKKKKDKSSSSSTSTSKKSASASSATAASAAADAPPPAPAAAAAMSEETAQKKGKDVVAEFAVSGELEEACTCLKEIDAEVLFGCEAGALPCTNAFFLFHQTRRIVGPTARFIIIDLFRRYDVDTLVLRRSLLLTPLFK